MLVYTYYVAFKQNVPVAVYPHMFLLPVQVRSCRHVVKRVRHWMHRYEICVSTLKHILVASTYS